MLIKRIMFSNSKIILIPILTKIIGIRIFPIIEQPNCLTGNSAYCTGVEYRGLPHAGKARVVVRVREEQSSGKAAWVGICWLASSC